MTITEALAEIKTIGKRIEKKKQFVIEYIARQGHLRDPLEDSGGSKVAIRNEEQAISDLMNRLVELRLAIARTNAATTVSVQNEAKTIAEWLVWKREALPLAQRFVNERRGILSRVRQEAAKQGVVITATAAVDQTQVVINIDEKKLAEEAEKLELIAGELDGALSVANATVTLL